MARAMALKSVMIGSKNPSKVKLLSPWAAIIDDSITSKANKVTIAGYNNQLDRKTTLTGDVDKYQCEFCFCMFTLFVTT